MRILSITHFFKTHMLKEGQIYQRFVEGKDTGISLVIIELTSKLVFFKKIMKYPNSPIADYTFQFMAIEDFTEFYPKETWRLANA